MWKGSFDPKRLFKTLVDEIKTLITGSPVWTIIPDHIDDLKVSFKPVPVQFLSTGARQKVPHPLGLAPAHVAIYQWQAPRDDGELLPTEIVIDETTDTDITVTSVAGTTITLLLYKPLRFPWG